MASKNPKTSNIPALTLNDEKNEKGSDDERDSGDDQVDVIKENNVTLNDTIEEIEAESAPEVSFFLIFFLFLSYTFFDLGAVTNIENLQRY